MRSVTSWRRGCPSRYLVDKGETPEKQAGMMGMPYVGSKEMLKKGDKWIVSNYLEEIQAVQREKPMKDFC